MRRRKYLNKVRMLAGVVKKETLHTFGIQVLGARNAGEADNPFIPDV
jgi:hypothetical protein